MNRLLITTILAFATLYMPAHAVETQLQLVIELSGNAERNLVRYACEGQEAPLEVAYLNAEPNYLALLTVDGEKRIFANVISGSGARYASGQFVWWTKGAEAVLTSDMAAKDAEPLLTCLEITNTP